MFLLVMVFTSCVRNKSGQIVQNKISENSKAFEVAEVIQAGSYTYLKVKENMSDRWVAVSKQEVAEGEVYYYDEALQMTNFTSKELNRTFDVIYFVNQISKTPVKSGGMAGQMPHGQLPGGERPSGHDGKVDTQKKGNISIEKAKDEITVGEIFSERQKFSARQVEIRGVVVKVNKNIMGKNWVHLQDGTVSDGKFDLTVTTQDLVQVNEEVTFRGTIILEKDFGAGYYYDVIMEEAELVSKDQAAATQL